MQNSLEKIEQDIKELRSLGEALISRPTDGVLGGIMKRTVALTKRHLEELDNLVTSRAYEAKLSLEIEEQKEKKEIDAPQSVDTEKESSEQLISEEKKELSVCCVAEAEPEVWEKKVASSLTDQLNDEVTAPTVQKERTLGEVIKPTEDLYRALSLNDTFRFSGELFQGDMGLMKEVLNKVSKSGSLDEAHLILSNYIDIKGESTEVVDFLEHISKHFA